MLKEKTGRGQAIKKEIRGLIINQAIHESKNMPRRALAVHLHDLIKKMGEVSPSEDTLIKMISAARNQQISELERPWSIGACARYNIPPDIIPVLINLQKMKAPSHEEGMLGQLTIREARWSARLYPAIKSLKNGITKDDYDSSFLLLVAASSYAQRERVSEQMNEQYPNTSDLDRLFFTHDDPLADASLDKWWGTFPTEYQQVLLTTIDHKRTVILEDLTQAKGSPLTNEETQMINDCFDIIKSGGPIALREFVRQYPLATKYDLTEIISSVMYSIAVYGDVQ